MPNYRGTKDWELKGVNPGAPWTLIASGTLPNPADTKPQSVDDETRHPLVVYQAHTPTMAQVKCLGVKHTNDIRNRFGFCDLLPLCMELPYYCYYIFICALPPNADADFIKVLTPCKAFIRVDKHGISCCISYSQVVEFRCITWWRNHCSLHYIEVIQG